MNNLSEYRALNACPDDDMLDLTLWRGKVFTVQVRATGRLMGIEFRNHPLKGWVDEPTR